MPFDSHSYGGALSKTRQINGINGTNTPDPTCVTARTYGSYNKRAFSSRAHKETVYAMAATQKQLAFSALEKKKKRKENHPSHRTEHMLSSSSKHGQTANVRYTANASPPYYTRKAAMSDAVKRSDVSIGDEAKHVDTCASTATFAKVPAGSP